MLSRNGECIKVVALLPMKGNSQRVKGKNFKDFNGKPLFQWILDTLLSVSLIDKVVINTDSRSQLMEYGVCDSEKILIRNRSSILCGDDVSMNLIIEDDIKDIDSDLYFMTHATNPLLSAQTILHSIVAYYDQLKYGKVDSLFSVNAIQSRFYRKDVTPINHELDSLKQTQELEVWFEENSNIYLFTSESFHNTGSRIGKKPMMYETPYLESIDIDTLADWELALAVSKSQKSR